MNIRYFQIFFISFCFSLVVGSGLYGFGHDFYAGYYKSNLAWGGFRDQLGLKWDPILGQLLKTIFYV